MKFISKYFILLAILIVSSSCNYFSNKKTNNNFNEIEKANWLIGTWQNLTADEAVTEKWEKKNDSTFVGKTSFVVKQDTVTTEQIELTQNNQKLFYTPTIKTNNEEHRVVFTLTYSDSTQLVFENTQHDFPQKITYTLINKDSLIAEISGTVNGKYNFQKFPFKRIK